MEDGTREREGEVETREEDGSRARIVRMSDERAEESELGRSSGDAVTTTSAAVPLSGRASTGRRDRAAGAGADADAVAAGLDVDAAEPKEEGTEAGEEGVAEAEGRVGKGTTDADNWVMHRKDTPAESAAAAGRPGCSESRADADPARAARALPSHALKTDAAHLAPRSSD